jgi:4-hydroxybutyrate CoA-transferase
VTLSSAAQAVERYVHPGDTVVIAPGMGEPPALVRALADQAPRLKGCRILSGLLLGDYPFLPYVGESFRYDTWHVMPPVRQACHEGRVGFLPVRGSRVIDLLKSVGVDVLLCGVSPERDGRRSLGASVSYPYPTAGFARRVIGEEHPRLPFTHGQTALPSRSFTAVARAQTPLRRFRSAPATDEVRAIAALARTLIPEGATLQAGLGAVAEAVLVAIAEQGGPTLSRLWGLATETAVSLLQAGLVKPDKPGDPMLIGGELMGSDRLLELAHLNPSIELHPNTMILDPTVLAGIDKFVSVNTALQVDLQGNVNCEVLDGTQVSGIGGAVDFVEGAALSAGGVSIIAITSTAGKGQFSRIVAELDRGAVPVTARHSVQYVVTEYGIADLRAKTVAERAEALVSIAHPAHRAALSQGRALLPRQER